MKAVILFVALIPGYLHARSSSLPVLFKCDQPAMHECHETYSSFEPAMVPPCGIGNSVRDLECAKGPDFLGACRSGVQGGGGYFVQSVLFYYAGHPIGDAARVEQMCRDINGEFIR